MRKINKYVIDYTGIPQDLLDDYSWIKESPLDSYVEVHVDEEEEDVFSQWILEKYPKLKDEESFFIYMDY